MSRKMIEYEVADGKITSIDGYEVGGELTGNALMNATKDSTTITRTLDNDGKVKFDNTKLPKVDEKLILNFEIERNKEYTAGEYIISEGVDLGKGYNNLLVQYLSVSGNAADMNTHLCAVSNTAEFRLLSFISFIIVMQDYLKLLCSFSIILLLLTIISSKINLSQNLLDKFIHYT